MARLISSVRILLFGTATTIVGGSGSAYTAALQFNDARNSQYLGIA